MARPEMTFEQFVEKCNILYNNKYTYDRSSFGRWDATIKIICPIHGVFTKKRGAHTAGAGCKKCAREASSKARLTDDKTFHDNKYINNLLKLNKECKNNFVPTKKSFPAELIKDYFDYCDIKGTLYWKERKVKTSQDKSWNKMNAGKEALCCVSAKIDKNKRKRGTFKNKSYQQHHVIWAWHHGVWPSLHIDHIDGNGLNNKISNLREVTIQENNKNLPKFKNNTSGRTGVVWDKNRNKWSTLITINSTKSVSLGRYDKFEDAVAIREEAEKVLGFHKNANRENSNADFVKELGY